MRSASRSALGLRDSLSLSEIDRSGITTAEENPDVLAGLRLITTRKECCKGGSTSRLGDYPQGLPESKFSTFHLVVGTEAHVVHILLADRVNESPHPAWCE